MKYFLIAGEPSGDAIGEKLIKAIKEQDPKAEVLGIGGQRMINAGMECLFDMNDLTVMGIWEVIMRLPQLKKIMDGIVADVEREQPDALITIDFPDFNFMVAEKIRRRGKTQAKLIHYVAPTVWAWRAGRAKKVASFLDAMICILPFEPEYFKAHNLRSIYVGNPIIEDHPGELDGEKFRKEQKIPQGAKVVGLCFGSRLSEIEHISPAIIEAVEYLSERYPDLHVVCPTISTLEFDILETIKTINVPKFVLYDSQKKWDALAACDFSITVSGTMALELAYAGCPHLCVYKTSPMTYNLVKSMVKTKFIHLANIIHDKMVVPEFVQKDCQSEKIALSAIEHIEDADKRDQQVKELAKIRETLGASQEERPSAMAARYIRHLIKKK